MTYNLPIKSIIDDYMDGMGTKRIADKYGTIGHGSAAD